MRFWFPYRSTLYGGFDFVYVIRGDGTLIKPIERVRSNSGRHGWDIYELDNGIFYAVFFSRANGNDKPVTVRYKQIVIDRGVVFYEGFITERGVPEQVMAKVRAIYNKLAGGES